LALSQQIKPNTVELTVKQWQAVGEIPDNNFILIRDLGSP
jgi:hypothetical protein